MNYKKLFFTLLLACLCLSFHSKLPGSSEKVLHHILLFQWAEGIEKEAQDDLLSLFNGLPAKIDGFERVEIYEITESSNDFDVVLGLQFTSKEALENYNVHPDHVKITEIAPPMLSGFSEYDYWK